MCFKRCLVLFCSCVFQSFIALRLPHLGKRELMLVLFVRLFDLRLFGFVCFLFLLVSGNGCGLCLWHSLDFSLTFFRPWVTPHTKWLLRPQYVSGDWCLTINVLGRLHRCYVYGFLYNNFWLQIDTVFFSIRVFVIMWFIVCGRNISLKFGAALVSRKRFHKSKTGLSTSVVFLLTVPSRFLCCSSTLFMRCGLICCVWFCQCLVRFSWFCVFFVSKSNLFSLLFYSTVPGVVPCGPYSIIVQVMFYFFWDHWANPGYFENRIPLKPALGAVCSLANYSVAYEEN